MSKRNQNSYETKLFNNNEVNVIKISLNDNLKYDLLDPDLGDEEYFNCNMYINDELVNNVGIRIKGGSTRMIFSNSNEKLKKYSLKIKFDEYIDGQTYYGLDEIELNNQGYDKTFMCDYFVYDMMRFMGIAAPLVSFADVYINDQYFGFYVCLENIKEAFLNRNFGEDYGELYKPTGHGLIYSEENYKNILDSAKTEISEEDKIRLTNSLKNLNSGNFKDSINIQKVIKYFAVNNFVGAPDNYFTNSPHNYYLYEKDGILEILPWDYDFAFFHVGCMDYYDFTEKRFRPIDNPISDGFDYALEERPLWAFIVKDEMYNKLYHDYIEEFINGYFYSGYFEKEYNRIYSLIEKHIISDYNKNFYIYENKSLNDIFKRIDVFQTICFSRAENVIKQISGEISTISNDNYSNINILEGYSYEKYSDYVREEKAEKFFTLS